MATVPETGNFELGRVFGLAFQALASNALLYIGLSLLLFGVPVGIFSVLAGPALATGFLSPAGLATVGAPGGGSIFQTISLIFGFVVVILVGYCMLQAALTRATIEYLNDRTPNFGECLQTGLRSFLPIIGIAVLSGLGIWAGSILFLIPGLILWVMWSVATPALIEEGTGVVESLGRSRALTKGSRWQIFGILIAMIVIGYIVQLLFGVVGGALGPVIGVGVSLLGSSISSALSTTAVAATYVELRTTKEGATASSLAAIFA